MNPDSLAPLANHLWQSTLCVVVAWFLTRVFSRQPARLRYGLWLAASVKFFVPFAALLAIGGQFGWRSARIVQPDVTVVLNAISQPFSQPAIGAVASPGASTSPRGRGLPMVLVSIWCCGYAMSLAAWRARWRRVAAIVRDASPVESGRELEALRRAERLIGTRSPMILVSSDASLEPGVVGILTPVLVWPRAVGSQLADREVDAILAHELCHVRRRDNLTAALHMAVEAVFWFYPLTWWLEKRLVDERERACDEAVIGWGTDPQMYAESIVTLCALCIASPFCVAGVTGSDLTRRVERIMRHHANEPVNAWRKLLLATLGVVALTGPIAVGVLNAPELQAQSQPVADQGRLAFEAVAIRPSASDDRRVADEANSGTSEQAGGICSPWSWIQTTDTCFRASRLSLRELITYAFSARGLIPPRSPIFGGPTWIDADRFDIVARAAGNAPFEPFRPAQLAPMMRTLLTERFKLTLHHESRTLPLYELRLGPRNGTNGVHLRPAAADCVVTIRALRAGTRNGPASSHDPCVVESGPEYVKGGAIDMSQLVWTLSNRLDRVVHDQTGFAGFFEINLTWPPDHGSRGSSIVTALQEQLGLTLEATTGPLDVLVIDRAEQPRPD